MNDEMNSPKTMIDNTWEHARIKVIGLEEKIMGENDQNAQGVRDLLKRRNIYAINLISSPGSGKTTLLVETLQRLKNKINCAVIEGDQQTSHDARRIAETGVPVVQVNTLQSCHLNAAQIQESLKHLPLDDIQLLFIENVGNLVCPAGMDLGENEKVVLMSVTEGEDKPAKYPLAFLQSHLFVLTKVDLLPYLKFDMRLCKRHALKVNPRIATLETSCITHSGLDLWEDYLRRQMTPTS